MWPDQNSGNANLARLPLTKPPAQFTDHRQERRVAEPVVALVRILVQIEQLMLAERTTAELPAIGTYDRPNRVAKRGCEPPGLIL